MIELRKSICRCCINQCAINVLVEDGRVRTVEGDPDNPQYSGYSCVKGRSQGDYLTDPARLLHPVRRRADGGFDRIASADALDEIAASIARIVDRHGPRAIAGYWGTQAAVGSRPVTAPFYDAFFDAIGTNMRFDPNTIDKGGKHVAQSFLGSWGAPPQGFDAPEAILLIGINPWNTYTGFPAGSPRRWLVDRIAGGCKLIVIDPRRTQVAERATVHLQAAPGHDVPILAAMIKVILSEGRIDHDFVARHVTGIDALREQLDGIEVAAVAAAAGVRAGDIVAAARTYAGARRGYAMAGTGPHMTAAGTLVEYLVQVLETLCGRWMRAGDVIKASPALLPPARARAQARAPDADWALGGRMRVRGLKQSRAGMPVAALAEEILTPGDGQVRALICWGGNPAVAFPDQRRVVEALRSLDLFVQIDPWMSQSAHLADYVLAPTLPLEVAAASIGTEGLSLRAGYGQALAHSQYTDAVVPRPAGSDLLEEWEIFYELMVRMGHPVEVRPWGHPPTTPKIPIDAKPRTEELLELFTAGSRVPLDTVKRFPGGHVFDEGLIVVEPGDPGNVDRLEVGHPEMMRLLERSITRLREPADARYPYRMLCRRENHANNSTRKAASNRGLAYNPAYLHPDDLSELGVVEDDEVAITSPLGAIRAIVAADAHLRRGMVSIAFGYGSADDPSADPAVFGSSPNRLVATDEIFDPFTGQPRMTDVPVAISRVDRAE
ncbi:molybdopterin-containing oxidoreductase family protein [Sphingomonas sp.]|uniref:molybdopterin-containing oxidoreductase family protein n=1 Tax=Sphingomonas sp. TaxID=28214 RepID=UPI002DD67A58|nr:molybdopterin-dependent oxidoreductase [Sphingomonas sp.]